MKCVHQYILCTQCIQLYCCGKRGLGFCRIIFLILILVYSGGRPLGAPPPPPRFSEFGEKAFQHFPYSKRCSSNNWSKLNISTITMLKNIIFYKKGLVLIDKTCLKHLILPLQNIKTNIGHHPKRAREHHLFCGPGNISTCHSHNAPDPLQQLASCTDTQNVYTKYIAHKYIVKISYVHFICFDIYLTFICFSQHYILL